MSEALSLIKYFDLFCFSIAVTAVVPRFYAKGPVSIFILQQFASLTVLMMIKSKMSTFAILVYV